MTFSRTCTSVALALACAPLLAQGPGSALGQQRSLATPGLALPPLPAASAARAATPLAPGFGAPGQLPSRTVPAATLGAPAGAQRAATPPVASPLASPAPALATGGATARTVPQPGATPSASAMARAGAQAGAQGKLSVPKVLSSPRRAQLVNEQLNLRAQENTLAKQARSVTAGPASTTAAPPSIARNAALGSAGPAISASQLLEPGIAKVNRKASGAVLTPGGYITIAGRGFGDTLGQVNVVGRFPNGALTYKVVDWRDHEIHALLPEGVSGVPDQTATLQVITREGKTWRTGGMRFVATRAEIVLATVDRVLDVYPLNHDWNPTVTPVGDVRRSEAGEKLLCKRPGEDLIRFKPMPPGWWVSALGYAHGRTDSGDGHDGLGGGSRTFFPGYGLGEWLDDRIRFNWGVWRSHASSGADRCESEYRLFVYVVGPAGLQPW